MKLISLEFINTILKNKTYCCEYQPFICTKTNDIYAYEALSRFWLNGQKLNPEHVFNICHSNEELFFNLELKMKEYQFKNRIKDKKLFINFDPHVFQYRDGINDLFKFFSDQDNFIIEIVENSNKSVNLKNLIGILQEKNIKFAVDDFFKENSMVSIDLLNNCEYIKLDIDILTELKRSDSFIYMVEGFVNFAHANAKKVIIEGVETKEDVEIVKKTDIDLMQGFYYKSRFEQGSR